MNRFVKIAVFQVLQGRTLRRLIIAVLIQLAGQAAFSQSTAPAELHTGIRVIAKAYGDSVVLRWAPGNNLAWTSLNNSGYIIERIDLSASGQPKRERLTVQPLKPMTLDQFKSAFGRDDKYAAIAAQCLYGKNFTTGLRRGQPGTADNAGVWKDRFAFALQVADFDGQVAKAEALRWTDTRVRANGLYAYLIYPAVPSGGGKKGLIIDTGSVLIHDSAGIGASRPRLAETIPGDRLAEIHWSRSQKEPYTGYYIERSGDGQHFSRVNKLPFFSSGPDPGRIKKDTAHARQYALLQKKQVFIDSLPQNYHRYFYRIRGINAFAEWSGYSDTLTVMGLDLTPPAPAIVRNPEWLGGRTLRLRWKKPVKEPDFSGWLITRAHSAAGPYTTLTPSLLPAALDQFTDTAAYPHGQNYYIVLALDTAGNMGTSIPVMGLVPDKTPPAVPTGLKGTIEKSGLVHLSWKANTDEDMKGYKVYFANSDQHVYSQLTLTTHKDTTFVDTISLRTLTKYIWYKVVAVDENNNHSGYSDPVKLKKPAIVPPMPPLASHVRVDSSGVQIEWINSPDKDVAGYIIYRKEKGADWVALSRVNADTSKKSFVFRDPSPKPFADYQYCGEAVDQDSLYSARSAVVGASLRTAPYLPALQTLTAVFDKPSGRVSLQWQYKNSGSYYFALYRTTGNESLARFHTAGQGSAQYIDPVPPPAGSTVSYAIQVLFKDERGRTRLSEPVKVNIP